MNITSTSARVPGWFAYDIRDFSSMVLVHVEAASEQEALEASKKILVTLNHPEPSESEVQDASFRRNPTSTSGETHA